MKKNLLLAIASLFILEAFGQSQACIVQVNVNSTANKCFSDCKGTAAALPQGVGPYDYSWTNGATTQSVSNLCAGSYTLSVKDLGDGTKCSVVFTITSPPQLIAVTSSNTISVSCSGKCDATATIVATGGTGAYTYSWIPGGQITATVTGLCAVPYQCDVKDANGCKASVTVIPTSPAPLNVPVTSGTGTATANPSGGTSPYTYSWNPTGQTGQTATSLTGGTYTVTVTDKNACTKTATVTVTTTGIKNNSNENSISIYPNPSSDFVTIEFKNENYASIKIVLTNLLGEAMLVDLSNSGKINKKQIDISKIPTGVYFLTVNTSTGSYTEKIIKK